MRSNMFGAVAVLALFAVAYGETTEETFTIDVKTAACNGYKLTSLKKEQAVSVFITDVGGSDSIKCSASANAAAMRVSELSLKQSDCAPNFKDDNLWGLTSKEITTESSTEPISSSDVSCTGDNTYLYFDNPCEEDRTVTVKVTYTPDANMKAICDFVRTESALKLDSEFLHGILSSPRGVYEDGHLGWKAIPPLEG
mmetsp:Transcript_39110/g.124505  ORF Transcript_39110/g.124505 Transcript_39110/m.124505 type:complete len:197 (-) Transcript_39110:282-872(-)